jgi:hypothetical protein
MEGVEHQIKGCHFLLVFLSHSLDTEKENKPHPCCSRIYTWKNTKELKTKLKKTHQSVKNNHNIPVIIQLKQ